MVRNNDLLRSLRHTLHASDATMIQLFALGGATVDPAQLQAILAREGEEGFELCPDALATAFLDGLILHKRGPSDHPPQRGKLHNNSILKRLRIAFQLRDDDIHALLVLADFPLSKPELNALFRQEHHPNYRACGDQLLRHFLRGLALRERR